MLILFIHNKYVAVGHICVHCCLIPDLFPIQNNQADKTVNPNGITFAPGL